MTPPYPKLDFHRFYATFDAPMTDFDCGTKCAPLNPSGKPFCCDVCHAVPAAYRQEWDYMQGRTNLWRTWQGHECPSDSTDPADLRAETPEHMLLLACKGPAHCQREFRLVSCRQFPFFPFVSPDYRFIGLAYEWAFEGVCWVIDHLDSVTEAYRRAFVEVYDTLFATWQDDLDSYAIHSEEMLAHFSAQKRRIPILHRAGGLLMIDC
jgi:hypothetical protein